MCENSASATAAAKPPARAPPGDETLSPDEDASPSDRAARRDGARGTLGGGVRRAPTTARGVPKPGAVPGARGSAAAGPRDAASPPSSSSPLATAARLTAAAASVAATTAAVAGVNLLSSATSPPRTRRATFLSSSTAAARSPPSASRDRAPPSTDRTSSRDGAPTRTHRPSSATRACSPSSSSTTVSSSAPKTVDRWASTGWFARAARSTSARPVSLPESTDASKPPDADEGAAAASILARPPLPPDAPVFIMLHGINGGSHEGPTKWAIATGAARGWRCVALNLRGCNGVKLASPKVYCAASSSDVRAAVNACRALYPNAPVLLAGYSLGTYVIGTYLAEEDSKPGGAAEKGVAGAVLVSCPLDPHSSHAGLSDPSRPAGLLYNGAIAAELEVLLQIPDSGDGTPGGGRGCAEHRRDANDSRL